MASAIVRMLKWTGAALLFLAVAACLAIALVPPFLDRIYYRGAESSHFDGDRFFNPDGEDTVRPPTGGSRGSFLLRMATGSDDRPAWPEKVAVRRGYPAAAATLCPKSAAVRENWGRCVDRIDPSRMFATWIGHATVLVQAGGVNILTDPIWSETAGPFGLGPKRVAEPGIRLDDLPKIDVILLSHNHYDHMDLQTLKALWQRDRPLIVTSLGNDTILRSNGIAAVARDWGTRVPVRDGIDVIVNRNHHWGSRWFTDRNRALWSSFVVTLPGGNLFFAGDTGLGDGRWPAEAARYGPIRLALIPIGAFRFEPGQMGTGSHIGPIDAVKVFQSTGAARGIGIHWGTFRLSYEAYDTPPSLLGEAVRCAGLPAAAFGTTRIGQTVEVSPYIPQPAARPLGPDCLNSATVRGLR
jgi:L-ascorbate metabolism protein UlaG (beta-lactamase superfamily)